MEKRPCSPDGQSSHRRIEAPGSHPANGDKHQEESNACKTKLRGNGLGKPEDERKRHHKHACRNKPAPGLRCPAARLAKQSILIVRGESHQLRESLGLDIQLIRQLLGKDELEF